MRRCGIALVSVLWVLAVGGAVALALRVRGRAGFESARNRATLTGVAWRAAGCASAAVAELETALASAAGPDEQDETWRSFDEVTLTGTGDAYQDCAVQVESSERALNVNAADEDALIAFFEREVGVDSARRLAHVLLGSAPFAALEEVTSVLGPGYDETTIADLSTSGTMVDVGHASARVLRTVPGITDATADAIVSRRQRGWRPVDPRELFDLVPPLDAEVLRRHFALTASKLSLTPRSWRVRAVIASPDGLSRTEELRVGRNGSAVLTIGRQVW